jgi:hypothetical protein
MHFIKICLGSQIRGLVDAERVVGMGLMVKPVELRQLERPRRRYEIILKLIFSDYDARL